MLVPPVGTVALLTQHGKDVVLEPLFRAAGFPGFITVRGFDTDQLGAFTGEVQRRGTTREAALEKARLALALSGCSVGLGSEGSFGPGPLGLSAWDLEVLVLLDVQQGLELTAVADGAALHRHGLVEPDGLTGFAEDAGFPEHSLVVRAAEGAVPVAKGLRTWGALRSAFLEARAANGGGAVFIENDLRADHNPTRMAVIAEAGKALIAKWQSRCPACACPGFAAVERVPGLPCGACGMETSVTRAQVLRCARCGHEVQRATSEAFASPGACDACNP